MPKIRNISDARNASSTKRPFDKKQLVEWFKSLSPEEQRGLQGDLDREELDRWKKPRESICAGEGPADKIGAIAADVVGRMARRRALGVPDQVDVEGLKEMGGRENAEAQYWPKLRLALKRTIKAHQKLQRELSVLRALEEERPSNQPRQLVHLVAAVRGESAPLPTPSAFVRDICLAERMNGLSLGRLEARLAERQASRGPRPNAAVVAVEGSLRGAGLGDARIGAVLQSERLEPNAGDGRARARSRRRQRGPRSRQN